MRGTTGGKVLLVGWLFAGDSLAQTDQDAGGATRSPPDAGVSGSQPLPGLPLLPVIEASPEPKPVAAARGKKGKDRTNKSTLVEPLWEQQNRLQSVAQRYVQLLFAQRFDEALLLQEEVGGRRPDLPGLRTAILTALGVHGAATRIEQGLTTFTGAELTTFYFLVTLNDKTDLGVRVALDHWGNVSGAGIGADLVAAARKRYDRSDGMRPKTALSLPFAGEWTASNATLGPGNGHYLNANQRFAIDFGVTEEGEGGKRRSHRDKGTKNLDYLAYGRDILAPADGLVVQAVDGVPDNVPGQVDVYFRLGNTLVLSFENGEYAVLSHLLPGSLRVRQGDRVQRGQVIAKCGNSGNSTAPHLHFQLNDGPLMSYASTLPAYFRQVKRNGVRMADVLPQSGDRLESAVSQGP